MMNTTRKIEVVLAVGALVALLAFIRPVGTGLIAKTEVHTQNINLELGSSEELTLKSLTGQGVRLVSLSLSGKVEGEGAVAVYLDDTLVYTNSRKKPGFGIITGLPVIPPTATGTIGDTTSAPVAKALFSVERSGLEFSETAALAEGDFITEEKSFANKCIETCNLPPGIESPEYSLKVYVTPGTKLLLGRLRYIDIRDGA